MKKAYVAYRCSNCKHISRITKRRRRFHRCSNCGTMETKTRSFMKWTWDDVTYFINIMADKDLDSEILGTARMITEARNRGDRILIKKKEPGRPAEVKKPQPKPRETVPKKRTGSKKKKVPVKPVKPEKAPQCWGKKNLRRNDTHCNSKCADRHSCRQEIEYQDHSE